MTRIAKQQSGVTRNPIPGTLLSVKAGEALSVAFDFENDSPDVADFHLEVIGTPDTNWTQGSGPAEGKRVKSFGAETLTLRFTPPRSVSPDDYPMRISIVSMGFSIRMTDVILRVEEADAVEFEENRADILLPAIETLSNKEPAQAGSDSAEAARTKTEAAPVPFVEPDSESRSGSTADAVPQEEDMAGPVKAAFPSSEPVAVKLDPPPPPPKKPRKPTAVVPDAPVIMDLDPVSPSEELVPGEEDEETPAEVSPLNLADGAVIALMPGESRLLRYSYKNDSTQNKRYLLNYDYALPKGWGDPVKDAAHVVKGGEEEVRFRLNIPQNAEPGDYFFTLSVGPADGILEPRNLQLTVLPTPIVHLSPKEKAVTVGPFARTVEFQLEVKNAGNADTAFRIAALAPQPPAGADEVPPEPVLIYEAPPWRYLFEQEMKTVKRFQPNHKVENVTIPLRVQRRGIWWVGWKKSHRLQVAAVPVTDPNNGGAGGNKIELVATCWRILPFSMLLVGPLLALLLVVSRPGHLRVTSPHYEADDGAIWVVSDPEKKIESGAGTENPASSTTGALEEKRVALEWNAPIFALLRLTETSENQTLASKFKIGSRSDEEVVSISSSKRRRTLQYRIASLLGGDDISVNCVLTRYATPLGIRVKHFIEKPTKTKTKDGLEITLAIPRGGYTILSLYNDTAQELDLSYWIARNLPKPTTSESAFYQPHDFLDGVLKHQTDRDYRQNHDTIKEDFVIYAKKSLDGRPVPDDATDKIVFITTDAARSILIVNLKIAKDKE